MINSKSDEIFAKLSKYITNHSQYNPKVKRNVIDNTYPLVVFEENTNTIDTITQDMYRLNQVRNLSYEISIFAINIDNNDSGVICDELASLVCDVMQEYYLMQGGIDAKLKNINTAKARKYVLHFNCKWNVRGNMLY